MKNLFGNNVFMPGDLVKRTKGRGGSKQTKENVWKIIEIVQTNHRYGAGCKLELVKGEITNSHNGKMEGPGYEHWYWLRDLTHVES